MKIQFIIANSLLSLLAIPTLVYGVESIRLDMLQGAKEISISRGQNHLMVKEGDNLLPKDELTTGPKESARITFPDRSELWVGSSTTIQINSGLTNDGHRIELVQMKEGSTRVLVPKSYGTTKRIKFVVRTPAATMGVRGTDFVVDAHDTGKDIELHTLDGTVDAAKSVQTLIKKDVVPVERGFTIHAQDGQVIPKPTSFDVSKFTTELNQRQPAFVTYSSNPVQQPETERRAPMTPAASSTSPGIKGKIENIMKQREGQIDNHP